jgi:hypothetical protein
MRLVLVHGRAQGRKSEERLREEWLPALAKGMAAAGAELLDTVEVMLPFYGAELDRLVDAPAEAYLSKGAGGEPDAEEAELLAALADRAGVTDAEVVAHADGEYVEKGLGNWASVQAVLRAICDHVPWAEETALARFVRDVNAYQTRPDVTAAVDGIVRAAIEGDDAVVVGHSLGSIVTYNVLNTLGAAARVPLYVTVGSPLGIPVVKRRLVRPLGMPAGVGHWLNASDERDFVALYARLDRDTFPATIENVSDLHNPRDDAHGIAGYLGDALVAGRIAAALRS